MSNEALQPRPKMNKRQSVQSSSVKLDKSQGLTRGVRKISEVGEGQYRHMGSGQRGEANPTGSPFVHATGPASRS